MSARVQLREPLCSLLRTELERVIYESCLHEDDQLIATRYYVEKVPQIDIAAELGWERSTVSRHLKRIDTMIEQTAKKQACP